MKYAFLITLISTIVSLASAQEIIFEKDIKLKRAFDDHRETYPVTNSVDKSIALFLIDKDAVQGLLFDQDLSLIKETDGDKPVNKFPELLGSSIINGMYTLYFSNKSFKSLTSVSYDFDQKTTKQNGVDLTIKKEQYIGALTYKNKLTAFVALSPPDPD